MFDFIKNSETFQIVYRFYRYSIIYLKPHKKKVPELLLYLLLGIAFDIFLPLTQMWVIDYAIVPKNIDLLIELILGIALIFLIIFFVFLREVYLTTWIDEKIVIYLRKQIFDNLQHASLEQLQRFYIGDIMSRLNNDVTIVSGVVGTVVFRILNLFLTFIFSLTILFLLNWKLALITLLVTPLLFIGNYFLDKPISEESYQRQVIYGKYSSNVNENLHAQLEVKTFNLEEIMKTKYHYILDKLFHSSLRLIFLSSIYTLTNNTITSLIQLIILGVGGYFIIQGELTLGALMAFIPLFAQVLSPIESFAETIQSFFEASGPLDRVEALLKLNADIKEAPHAQPLEFHHRIVFKNVEFLYDEKVILNKVNFEIKKGEKVAFVGLSGSGKSTILKLILRLIEPQKGHILIDDTPLKDITLSSLHKNIGTIFQETYIFSSTIYDNITLFDSTVNKEEVHLAIHQAQLEPWIKTLSEGIETRLGEGGQELSGGQKQRIGIARAIKKSVPILLLDEVTSALDAHTEDEINHLFESIYREHTMIIATHKLKTLIHIDKIFFLEDGEIKEVGTHETLVAKKGYYYALWQKQQIESN